MQPISKNLRQLLTNLVEGAAPDSQACAFACNYRMEERVARPRQMSYETRLFDHITNLDMWQDGHTSYLKSNIWTPCPETFTIINNEAVYFCQENQNFDLIRIERLDDALQELNIDLVTLAQMVDSFHGKVPTSPEVDSTLVSLARRFNTDPFAGRPRFAGLKKELEEDIQSADWSNRLRNRLGLHHLDPILDGPIPVALMCYPVEDVLQAAKRTQGAVHPVTLPTVLDHRLSGYFCPSPRDAVYGQTMDLSGINGNKKFLSEVIHLRMDYQPNYFLKVGFITAPLPSLPLKDLREWHILCLQEETGRDDFGLCEPDLSV